MKFLSKGLMLAFAVVLLTGCGGEDKLTCTMTSDGGGISTKITATYYYKDDKVYKADTETEMELPDESTAETSYSMAKAMYDTLAKEDGFTASIDLNGKKIIAKVGFDLTKVSEETLKNYDLELPTDDTATKDETKKAMEDQGYTCK